MTGRTVLPEAAADTAAERYLASFPAGQVQEFRIQGLDLLDVPLHSASLTSDASLSSARSLEASEQHPAGSGLGYGATPEQARTGALGEMAEMALSTLSLAGQKPTEGSYAELVRRCGADRVQDPRTLGLEAGSSYTDDRPLQWLPMTRLRDGDQVLVPAEFVASTPADLPGIPPAGGWLTTVITNGQGAGFGEAHATAHAVLELLQRDGNAVSFRAMDQGVVIDTAGLIDPDALALLDQLDAAGIDVLVKLADTAFGIPSVYAVGCLRDASEPVPVMVTACGEAAHPDPQAAVRKALQEFAAARSRKAFMHGPLDLAQRATPPGYVEGYLQGHPPERLAEESRALEAMLAWSRLSTDELTDLLAGSVLARRSTIALTDLPSARPADLCGHVVGALHAAGLDVLVDRQPARAGDAVAVKALVPGLEVETMSYGRIGERGVRRLLDREDPLVAVGARPDGAGWAAVHLTWAAQERLGGPAWFNRLAAAARVGALYPLYREPGRHAVAIATAGRTGGLVGGRT